MIIFEMGNLDVNFVSSWRICYLFYIPWMKRIETHIAKDNSCISVSYCIYSIYLEWKGLRRTGSLLHVEDLCSPLEDESILYTLNEKDWDLFTLITYKVSILPWIISILYTLNEKDWDVGYHSVFFFQQSYLFYIPWMKRIET